MVNYLISSISLYHTSNVHLSVNKNKIKLKQNQGICFEGSTIKHSVSKIKFGKRVVICLEYSSIPMNNIFYHWIVYRNIKDYFGFGFPAYYLICSFINKYTLLFILIIYICYKNNI